MIITKKALPRRTFLRGLGTTLALPLLDAMVPAMAATRLAAKPAVRLGSFMFQTGSSRRIGFLRRRALGSILLRP